MSLHLSPPQKTRSVAVAVRAGCMQKTVMARPNGRARTTFSRNRNLFAAPWSSWGGSSSGGGDGEEVEAVAEDDGGAGPVRVHGGAGPAVVGGEVAGERRRRAGEAAALAGASARRGVRARQGVGVAVVVRRPVGAAAGGVRARDADGAQQGLHVVAPAVAARRRGAALVALGRRPQLVVAPAAHHVPDVALHTHARVNILTYLIS